MHRVGSAGNTANSVRPRKEKRLTYILNDADGTKHCAGVNCLALLKSSVTNRCDYLFTGSRDGTLKRWALSEDGASCAGCSATFESHVDWVNDAIITGGNTLVSCSSDTTLKSNIIASGGLGGEVFVWDLEAALAPTSKTSDATDDDCSNMINGHKESVYALGMNDSGTLLVSGGTEKVVRVWDPRTGSKTIKLRGHTDNIRALLLDSTGRLVGLSCICFAIMS
ncbi:transducin/WD40 repeat-like superfamily protein [Actinidia rufa]|uniref:Transducin/WD40 repeat-like superfamily protein n=1 Tax=Actinidia rufa TaxID=165716 RepID=A0A7J0FWK1_9ERIC|nr:transducin/WD40 repeat-like superfamily protein [Actinidia rufa]